MRRVDYRVGWVCALPCERAAAICMLDEQHDDLAQPEIDHNNYTLGRIGSHNVVIASLPAGVTGLTSAGRVALQMRSTFTSIRVGFLVGIGGGVPSELHDIQLGDVIISRPGGRSGGVIQYDFGKTVAQGRFVLTGSLNRPPDILLNAQAKLEARHMLEGSKMSSILTTCAEKYPLHAAACFPPALADDVLFQSSYDHEQGRPTCSECDGNKHVTRTPRSGFKMHYGLIASGNQVMRDGNMREKLRKELDVLCFEMEAAALMDDFPCLVVRGISDYADTHKNKAWQSYAAMTAAAYTKELLSVVPGTPPEITDSSGELNPQTSVYLDSALLLEAINLRNDSVSLKLLSLAACIIQLTDRISYTLSYPDQGFTEHTMWHQYRLQNTTNHDIAATSDEIALLRACIESRQKSLAIDTGVKISKEMNHVIDVCMHEASIFILKCTRVKSADEFFVHTAQTLTALSDVDNQLDDNTRIRNCMKQCQSILWKELPLSLRETLCLGTRRINKVFSCHQTCEISPSQSDITSASAYNRAIAAIIQLQDGSHYTLKSDDLDEALDQIGFKFQTKMIIYDRNLRRGRPLASKDPVTGGNFNTTDLLHPSFVKHQAPDVFAHIVDSLYFRAFSERQARISSPYESTFNWIFKDPQIEQKPWSNFTEWLERGDGCYWVSGKAGSGKSTLAKYLWQHQQLISSLESWAGSDHLLKASFFFWHVGSPLQKSQAGLIQSLLYDLLSPKRSLVLDVLPELCFAYVASSHLVNEFNETSSELPLQALKTGLKHVLSGAIPRTKIFLLIDGLDEYYPSSGEANEYELPQMLLKESKHAGVKLLVCSRPEPACHSTFRNCPKLRLQDLNRDDIAEVIHQDIRDNELFGDLEELFPESKSQLTRSISEKADGVFLWVRLVIKEIHRRVPNFDNPHELMRVLEELPPDLEELYEAMLRKLLPEHREDAAMMLQLVARSLEKQHLVPMTLLQLSHAIDEEAYKGRLMPVAKISATEEERKYKLMEGRLRSRSLGLLEIQADETFPRVVFLHKTVHEFLKIDLIERELDNLSRKLGHERDEILLDSCLAVMKEKPLSPVDLLNYLLTCLSYLNALEEQLNCSQKDYWDVIEAFMSSDCHKLPTFLHFQGYHSPSSPIKYTATSLGLSDLKIPCPDANLALLLFGGLPYTMDMVLRSKPLSAADSAYYVFQWITFLYCDWNIDSSLTPHIVLKALDILLQQGAGAGAAHKLAMTEKRTISVRDAPLVTCTDDDGISAWEWLAAVLSTAHNHPFKQADLRFRLPTILHVLHRLLSQEVLATQAQVAGLKNFLLWTAPRFPQETSVLERVNLALPAAELRGRIRTYQTELSVLEGVKKPRRYEVEESIKDLREILKATETQLAAAELQAGLIRRKVTTDNKCHGSHSAAAGRRIGSLMPAVLGIGCAILLVLCGYSLHLGYAALSSPRSSKDRSVYS